MSTYTEKLQKFLDEDCGADWGNCPACPGDHYKDGACQHPDHPSTQEIETEPFEHCECGTRTGGGHCGPCKELIQNESAGER